MRRYLGQLDAAALATREMSDLVEERLSCRVLEADVLEAPATAPFDLVVTSPPYPNAYSYHLYHRSRLIWLGYDPERFKKIEIGSHRKYSANCTSARGPAEASPGSAGILPAWTTAGLRPVAGQRPALPGHRSQGHALGGGVVGSGMSFLSALCGRMARSLSAEGRQTPRTRRALPVRNGPGGRPAARLDERGCPFFQAEDFPVLSTHECSCRGFAFPVRTHAAWNRIRICSDDSTHIDSIR